MSSSLRASNKIFESDGTAEYDPEKETVYNIYLDANNQYGHGGCQQKKKS